MGKVSIQKSVLRSNVSVEFILMYLNVEDILSTVSHGSRLLRRLSQKPRGDAQALDFDTSSGDSEKTSATLEPEQKGTK